MASARTEIIDTTQTATFELFYLGATYQPINWEVTAINIKVQSLALRYFAEVMKTIGDATQQRLTIKEKASSAGTRTIEIPIQDAATMILDATALRKIEPDHTSQVLEEQQDGTWVPLQAVDCFEKTQFNIAIDERPKFESGAFYQITVMNQNHQLSAHFQKIDKTASVAADTFPISFDPKACPLQ